MGGRDISGLLPLRPADFSFAKTRLPGANAIAFCGGEYPLQCLGWTCLLKAGGISFAPRDGGAWPLRYQIPLAIIYSMTLRLVFRVIRNFFRIILL